MTASVSTTASDIEQARTMIAACRARIDADPHLPEEVRRMAHLRLDAVLLKFLTDMEREAIAR